MELLPGSFKKFIEENSLFTQKDRLLIAVSGGVDSVVLCELCFLSGFSFAVAHCNFQLRGQESDGDARLAEELAQKYQVPFYSKEFHTPQFMAEQKVSLQVAARELRYQWFAGLINDPNLELKYLLTAHHADDNVETISMNFFKGSGIGGLKGILPKQQYIIRPLLFATKEAIISFANNNKLVYREDSSNSSDKYTRNYFRNELLPSIEKVFPAVRENLRDNAQRFREIHSIYTSAVKKIIDKLVVENGTERHIPVLKLQQTESMSTVLYEILKQADFSAAQSREAAKLVHSESGKYIDSATHRLLRNRKWLILAPLINAATTVHVIERPDGSAVYPGGVFSVAQSPLPGPLSNNQMQVQLDAREISFPLLFRKWKTGDYFYPLGMLKKKKISRFLIDLKLSLHRKQDVWVVESDRKIVWVVGHRIDERFKIRESTKAVLLLSVQ